jgi:Ca2+-binding EF-hand superfamily protein
MRVTRWSLTVVGCLALALLTAGAAQAQWGGGRRGGWGGGGGRFDPSFLFNRYANGKDYIVIAEVTRARDKDAMTEYAQRKGITNGRLTREQFNDYWQDRMASRRGNRGAPSASASASPSAAAGDDPAKASFDRLDANKDGLLTDNEIPSALRSDMGKWDSNRDGKIQLEEYRAFFKSGASADSAVPGLHIVTPPSLEELDKRATVFRAGHLPPELQRGWFEELDTDKDGQIGLYEWKAGGKSLEMFRAMDVNGDGFVTAEEALRYLKKNPAAAAELQGTSASRFGRFAANPYGPSGPGNNDWRSRMDRRDRSDPGPRRDRGPRRGPGSP